MNINAGNLATYGGKVDYIELYVREGNNFSWNDLTHSIWNNILNNIIYIYKTKGTPESM